MSEIKAIKAEIKAIVDKLGAGQISDLRFILGACKGAESDLEKGAEKNGR